MTPQPRRRELNSSLPVHSAEQAFIVTVGLPMGTQAETNRHCEQVLAAIRRTGYQAGPTSNESMRTTAEQMALVDGIAANDLPEGE